jgi:hypothetical protein
LTVYEGCKGSLKIILPMPILKFIVGVSIPRKKSIVNVTIYRLEIVKRTRKGEVMEEFKEKN